jgi:hypothetical protein
MKKGLLLAFAALSAWAGFAQEAGLESSALFISKLKAKAEQSRIVLTWHNPRNLRQPLLLYRHVAEITEENLGEATLIARLTPDQESYEDSPEDYNPHYYAVLIEDARRLLIPFRNKTSQAVRVEVLPSVDSLASRITGIRASVVDEAVQVTFTASNPDRELLLFRSNSPMLTTEDLLDAFAPLQLEKGTERVTDFPIPGVQSYYAVIDTEMFKLGRQELVPGENTTTQAAVVPVGVQRAALPPPAPAVRPAAEDHAAVRLPYLQPKHDGRIAASMPQRPEPLDARTREAVSRILASAPPLEPSQRSVVILPEDRNCPGAGESASLREILQEHLLAGDYRAAEAKLQGFLNLKRSAYTEARVRFYLAQAYYFQGLYEEALLEFVLAEEQLYGPVQPWLQSCFQHLWNKP